MINIIKSLSNLALIPLIKRSGIDVQVSFSTLPYESHHQGAFKGNFLILAGLLKNGGTFVLQFFKQPLNLFKIGVLEGLTVAAGQIKGYRGRKKPKRGANAGQRWHQYAGRTDLFCQTIGVHRSGAAEGRNRNDIRITALFGNMGFGGCCHGFVDQVMNTKRSCGYPGFKGFGHFFFDGLFGQGFIQQHATTQKIVRIQISQHQVGIGHRWVLTAAGITGRSGISTGTFRSHLQQAHFAHVGNAAAAGADFHQIYHRYLNGQTAAFFKPLNATDLKCRHQSCLSFLNQTGFGGGAAHIKTKHVLDLKHFAVMLRGNYRGCWPGFYDSNRIFASGFHRGNATAG